LRARWSIDLTVPAGIPMRRAISSWPYPSTSCSTKTGKKAIMEMIGAVKEAA
jgi:hypothetical protein